MLYVNRTGRTESIAVRNLHSRTVARMRWSPNASMGVPSIRSKRGELRHLTEDGEHELKRRSMVALLQSSVTERKGNHAAAHRSNSHEVDPSNWSLCWMVRRRIGTVMTVTEMESASCRRDRDTGWKPGHPIRLDPARIGIVNALTLDRSGEESESLKLSSGLILRSASFAVSIMKHKPEVGSKRDTVATSDVPVYSKPMHRSDAITFESGPR